MLKILTTTLCLLFSINISMACTDFSGTYQYDDSPSGQVDFSYIQSGCDSIIIKSPDDSEIEVNEDFQLLMSIQIGDTITDIFVKVMFTDREMIETFKITRTENEQSEEENIVLKISKLANGDLSIYATYDDGHVETAYYRKLNN